MTNMMRDRYRAGGEVTNRITTRCGRKIRHVAPGHVVDVATGQGFWRWHFRGFSPRPVWLGMEPWGDAWLSWWDSRAPERQDGVPKQFTIDRMLGLVPIPAGICAFVAWAVRT